MTQLDPQRVETLGPAERILQTLMTWSDHMYHGRPGMVTASRAVPGVKWAPVTHKVEDGQKVVYRMDKRGRKTVRTRVGVLNEAGDKIVQDGREVAEYRAPGLFPEVAAWLYSQVSEVWKLDNDFAARWASWAFVQDHRDLKVVLTAFMLVQSRSGEPVREGGELLFFDDDHRAVGEAMCLIRRKDKKDLNPKLLLRVGELLRLPQIAALNRELGFGRSARTAPMGRYTKAVTRWLRHRERNLPMLEGLVKAGYRTTVMQLARQVGYKPETERFFEVLRWKQKQAPDGRRDVAIGAEVAAAESWDGMSEAEVCQRIIDTRPDYKRVVGLLPRELGLTRAVLAAAVEAGSLSDADLIILTPTLEDLDLLNVPAIAERWTRAAQAAEDQRAAHIATRVRRKDTAEALQVAADRAVQRAVEEVTRGLRVYVAVDISGSMSGSIEKAKGYLTQFLQGFPLERTTVCVFNTTAREVEIRHASAKGVEHAFRGFRAGGGTSHGAAVRSVFASHPPAADEDALFLFVGDQQDGPFAAEVRKLSFQPVAFGVLNVPENTYGRAVENTATELGLPCFKIQEGMFGDAYAVTRTLRTLIASTPVGKATARRTSLVETILKTELLTRPVWAA
jgi:hypothetical protein